MRCSCCPATTADRVLTAQADLAVAHSLTDRAPALRAVRRRGLPLVVIDQSVVPGSARVAIDDHAGAEAPARHLLDLGHRRFGVLSARCLSAPRGGPLTATEALRSRFRDNRERLRGYLDALADAGVRPEQVPIWEVSARGEKTR